MEILFGDGHLIQMLDYKPGRGSATVSLGDTGKPQLLFRYIILKVTATSGDSTTQFSAWQFTTSSGSIYQYPSSMTLSWSNPISFFSGEGLSKAVISDTPSTNMGKACFSNSYSSYPAYFLIDLHDDPINIAKYSRWRWYTSNDTASNTGRNLKSFELFVSNEFNDFDDHTNWKSVDAQTNYNAPTMNYSLAYTGKIKI